MKAFLPILFIVLLASCRTTRETTTTQVNTDSIVSHVKDSMTAVHKKEIETYQKHIEELSSSGVTFVVDSCPERDAVLQLLDSAGRANYEKALLQDKIKSLTNKVTISEKGVITAEGQIKSAYFSKSLLQDELFKKELTIDSLHKVVQTDSVKFSKQISVKEKVVTRTVFPWYFWLLLLVAAVIAWVVKGRFSQQKRMILGDSRSS